jgi:hypothetical protein
MTEPENGAVRELLHSMRGPNATKPTNPAPNTKRLLTTEAKEFPVDCYVITAPVVAPAAPAPKPIPNIPGLTTGSLLLARSEREPLTRPSGKL